MLRRSWQRCRAQARASQQSLELVDGQHRSRRIVDRGGERLDGDVNEDTEREQRILIHGPFGAESNAVSQDLVPDGARTAMEKEQRFIRAHEVAHLRHKFDHTVRAFRRCEEFLQIDRENDRRCALMEDRAHHRAGILLR